MKSVQIITLGCSKNTVDTEHILYQVRDELQIVPQEAEPAYVDYLLLNTCGFIGDAKEESVNAIMSAVQRKNDGMVGRLIVFGCLSQRYSKELPKLIPEVDEWYGAREFDPVVRALGVTPKAENESGRIFTEEHPGSAYLKISEGCDRRCSYCAIPYIRGAHRSVPVEKLVAETEFLASRGVKELVLIAQDTTYYGLDLYKKRTLAELIDRLSRVEGIEWIRIHYSYPSSFPEDVLEMMAHNPKVCPYLDIPLQHISDRMLDMMHRHCDSRTTRELVRKLRSQVPGVALRTTMIVGHPGEGEEEFQELIDFVREAKFERLGAFTYSEEEGTYGAKHFADDIPQDVKDERLSRLMALQQEISSEFNASRVGTEERVMVDAYADGVLVCRSRYESPEVDGEILVRYDSSKTGGRPAESLLGEFVNVRIVGAGEYDLTAELI